MNAHLFISRRLFAAALSHDEGAGAKHPAPKRVSGSDRSVRVGQVVSHREVKTNREGMNDTASREKTITAVVTATFALK